LIFIFSFIATNIDIIISFHRIDRNALDGTGFFPGSILEVHTYHWDKVCFIFSYDCSINVSVAIDVHMD